LGKMVPPHANSRARVLVFLRIIMVVCKVWGMGFGFIEAA